MSSLTVQWLNNNTLQYPQSALLISHVTSVLTTYTTLRVKTAPYTYNDGRTQLLLCLHGLLPITYRGSAYNIPIDVWCPLNYGGSTDSIPIVYVVPTSEMGIRTGKGTIESDGRVVSERYLDEWQRKSEGRNLSGLIQSLQETFGKEPPVYARTAATSTPKSTSTTSTPSSTHQPQATQSQDLPARPPKPGSTSPIPSIQHPQSVSQVPNNRYASPASLSPPQPQQLQRPQSTSYASPPPPPLTVVPTHLNAPVNHRWSMPPPLPQQPSPPQPAPTHQQPPIYPSLHTFSPPPPPQQHQQMAPPVNLPPSQPRPHPTLPSIPPPNFLDSDIPTPQITQSQVPSLPPNPHTLALHTALHQKLHTSLASLSTSHDSAMARLRTLQTDLLTGEPAIRDEIGRLGAVRDLCRGVCGQTGSVVREAEQRVAWLRSKGEVGVDEVVCSSDVVWNQLIDLVAEDNALEDTIYHLHRAHNAGRIDLERFLRTARALAEEQFMKRALVEKILKLVAGQP